MVFQRHCSQNGRPVWVLSDNENEYILGKDELWKLINSDITRNYFAEHHISWKFSPKRSPKNNSVSDSSIKVTKDALYRIFGTTKLTENEFYRALKCAQSRVNQRPLVGVYDDPSDDNLLTLTGRHLKLGRAATTLPSSIDELYNLDNIRLSIMGRSSKRNIIEETFYIKWKHEYLSSLSKNKGIASTSKDVKVGSIVLLLNERKTRDDWPIARVERVFNNKDNVVRSVELSLPTNVNETKKRSKNLPRKQVCINIFILVMLK